MERWQRLAENDPELADFDQFMQQEESVLALTKALFANSPYLTQSVLREPHIFRNIIMRGPDQVFDDVVAEARGTLSGAIGTESLMAGLRKAKQRVALAVAVADIADFWDLGKVTGALSRFADLALDLGVEAVLRDMAAAGHIEPADSEQPCLNAGLTVLGMGKLGAMELNYSSDIDIIVLYDPDGMRAPDRDGLRGACVRATRQLIRILEERTADGYVFRMDLRLRPDPGATPPAVALPAALSYYESMGQNWERAAMIKARPVAGDIGLGHEFLEMIRPFMWRKSLDFAAIQDIHSIKRQIAAHRGGTKISVEGHDVKVGRGGIREIELYTQTQQLIWGGRQPSLRLRGTLAALKELTVLGHVDPDAADELSQAYDYLRRVEHRLQMTEDKQTQRIPNTAEGVDHLAAFLAHADTEEFRNTLIRIMQTVDRRFAVLFADERPLGGDRALVFTGTDDHPDTVETLQEMGFEDAARVSALIRAWHAARYRATRSERSRQILTELMPRLLGAFAHTTKPDEALVRFDRFLSGLPSGVQLFSLFHANPPLLDLVAEIMGNAPRMAQWLSRKPSLLEAVLTEPLTETWTDPAELRAELDEALKQAKDYQDCLDITRRWVGDHKFRIGLQVLHGRFDVAAVERWLSNVADTAISVLVEEVERSFAEAHGRVDGGGLTVLAFGKLGGRELLPESDLDLVFLYWRGSDDAQSDGEKPLGASVYYNRLVQRIITALTTLTPEGALYEVDTRLRPAGNAGPVAVPLEGFLKYYETDAWTWEHMALTRARAVCGPPAMRQEIETIIETVLARDRDRGKLYVDIADMRRRIEKEHPGSDPWNIKHRRGGLFDLDFISQTLTLEHSHRHSGLAAANTAATLDNLAAAKVLDDQTCRSLQDALRFWHRLQAFKRLTVEGKFDADAAPVGLKRTLAEVGEVPSFDDLPARMEATAQSVQEIYKELIDDVADAARAKASSE